MALLDTLLLVQLREQLDARAEHGSEVVPFVRGL